MKVGRRDFAKRAFSVVLLKHTNTTDSKKPDVSVTLPESNQIYEVFDVEIHVSHTDIREIELSNEDGHTIWAEFSPDCNSSRCSFEEQFWCDSEGSESLQLTVSTRENVYTYDYEVEFEGSSDRYPLQINFEDEEGNPYVVDQVEMEDTGALSRHSHTLRASPVFIFPESGRHNIVISDKKKFGPFGRLRTIYVSKSRDETTITLPQEDYSETPEIIEPIVDLSDWVSQLNPVLQLVMSVSAVITGIAAVFNIKDRTELFDGDE